MDRLWEIWASETGQWAGFFAVVVIADFLGFVSLRLYRPKRALAVVVVLTALSWGVWTQAFFAMEEAARQYWVGTPRWHTDEPSNPDRVYRLEQTNRYGSSPWEQRWSDWNNRTLWVLLSIFGRSPGAYTGAYPTREEALKLLRGRGEAPKLVANELQVSSAGSTYAICDCNEGDAVAWEVGCGVACEDPLEVYTRTSLHWAALTDGDVESGRVLRVVEIEGGALLVASRDEVSLRRWSKGWPGRVWARWPSTEQDIGRRQ